MTIPLWVLLAFAVWTLLVLIVGVGAFRGKRILSGKADPVDFPGGVVEGAPYYRRATRAHANCLENLPVYGAIALTATVAGVDTPRLDQLAVVILIARMLQSVIHLALPVSNNSVRIRGAFFLVQVIAMLWMAIIIATSA